MTILPSIIRAIGPLIRRRRLSAAMAAAALFCAAPAPAEIMSIATQKANIREGPGVDTPALWQAWRFTPFEVLDWSGEWAHVEDFTGDTGWLHRSVLSKTPAVIITGKYANIRSGPGPDYEVVTTAEREYPLKVIGRDGDWINVSDEEEGIDGWIFKTLVWGNKTAETD